MAKTPSVLKWMINRRARLLGEISKAEKRYGAREIELQKEIDFLQARAQRLQDRLVRIKTIRVKHVAVLQQDLASIDAAMGQHHILIDVDLVRPTRGQDNAWLLPHGVMSRLILRSLREADGGVLDTNQVALFVAEEGKLDIHPDVFRSFKIAIRRRMRALHAAGLLRRIAIGNRTMDSRWAAIRPSTQGAKPQNPDLAPEIP